VEATKLNSKERTTTYATGQDFCRIFKEDMKNLYQLAFCLAADPAKAEQCFVSGLEDCATGNRVFKEWARSWARRTVIRNALRLVAPRPPLANASSNRPDDAAVPQVRSVVPAEASALLELDSFDRFAFVMSVLEGYSDQDSALLLGCTRQTLIAARVRALQQLARSASSQGDSQTSDGPKADRSRNINSVVKLTLPALLVTPA